MSNKNTAKKTNKNTILNTPMKIVLIVGAVVLVGAIVLAIIGQTGVFNANKKVITIGEDVVDGIEYSYYYGTTVSAILNQNYYSLYYSGYDFSKTPGRQTTNYSSSVSWKDYFMSMTNSSIVQVSVLKQEAQKANFVGDPEEIQSQVDYYVSSLEKAAADAGKSTKAYLAANYGNGMTLERFKEYVSDSLYTLQYREHVLEELKGTITEEQLNEYLNKNITTYTSANYRVVTFNFSSSSEDEKQEAKDKADNLLEIGTTAEAFEQYAHDQLSDDEKESKAEEDLTLVENITVGNLSNSDMIEWLMDESRVEGDTQVFENSNNYNVIYFISTSLMDYNLRNARHIYVLFDDENDASGNAKKKVDEIRMIYDEGEKTEEAFAALAKKYSSDSDTSSNGGLLENVSVNQYVASINDWIFDNERKAGDVDVVSSAYGYHILYYVGEGEVYWKNSATENIANDLYEDEYADMEGKYLIKIDNVVANRIAS